MTNVVRDLRTCRVLAGTGGHRNGIFWQGHEDMKSVGRDWNQWKVLARTRRNGRCWQGLETWKVLAGIRGHGRFSQGLKYIDIGKAVEVTVNSKEEDSRFRPRIRPQESVGVMYRGVRKMDLEGPIFTLFRWFSSNQGVTQMSFILADQ